MPRVESSAVEAVEHDAERNDLIVTFSGGARYVYAGVPAALHAELLASASIGGFVNREIKPNFPARLLTPRSGRGRRSPA